MSQISRVIILLAVVIISLSYAFKDKIFSSSTTVFSAESLTPELSIHGEQYLKMLLERQYVQLSNELELHLLPSKDGQDIEILYALNSLVRDEEWLLQYLDEWVKATPKKAVPYIVRANFLMNQGVLARGTDYIRNTPQSDLIEMRRLFKLSIDDLKKVKSINAQTAYPYAIELNIALRQGSDTPKKDIYSQGILRDPALNWVRHAYLSTLDPKWGGSTDEEMQFIEELRPEYVSYPWLKSTEVSWMINNVDALPQETCDKVAEYLQVYEFHRNSWSSYNVGKAYSCNLQFEEALQYLNESVELWPHRAIAWRLIGAIQHKLGNSEEAFIATRKATHLDPSDSFSFYQLGNIAMYLERYQAARESYQIAVKVEPGNADYPQYVELAEKFAEDSSSPHELYLLKDSLGGMVSKTIYVNGRKEGEAIVYNENNRPKELHLFENDVLQKVTRVHPEGFKTTELAIKNDKYNGLYQEYSPSGKVISTGILSDGLLSGDMKLFFENGKLILSNSYEYGKKIKTTNFVFPVSELKGVSGVSIASEAISHILSPLNQVSRFTLNSGNPIFIYTALDGLEGDQNELLVEIFDAKGRRVFDYLTVLQNSGDGFNYSYVYYSPDQARDSPGKWQVTISLNSEEFDSFPLDVN